MGDGLWAMNYKFGLGMEHFVRGRDVPGHFLCGWMGEE